MLRSILLSGILCGFAFSLPSVAQDRIYWGARGEGLVRSSLDGSGPTTIATARSPLWVAVDPIRSKVYWTDGQSRIDRCNLDGSEIETILTVASGVDDPAGIALDLSGAKIYWANADADDVWRANLDGTNPEKLLDAPSPSGIDVDSSAGKVYWCEASSGRIRRADFDGSNAEDLVTGLSRPQGLALDPFASKIYWAESDSGRIARSELDGTNVETLLAGLNGPAGISLDPTADRMYWAEFGGGAIRRARLDGSSVEDVVTNGVSGPLGLFVCPDDGRVYWCDRTLEVVRAANLDGTSVRDLVIGLPTILRALDVDPVEGKVYWGARGRIQRANLDGSEFEFVLVAEIGRIEGLALDHAAEKIYFTDFEAGRILRADFDGLNVETLIDGLSQPAGIDVDPAGGKFYWSETGSDKIRRANLDGSIPEDLASSPVPWALALDSGGEKLYWTDASDESVRRSDLDGSNVEGLASTPGFSPQGIAVDSMAAKLYWADVEVGGGGSIRRSDLDGSNLETVLATATRDYGLVLGPVVGETPANDTCATAATIKIGDVVTASTKYAGLDAAGACPPGVFGPSSPGVWYRILGDGTILEASLCEGTEFDARLTVLQGDCSGPTCVTTNFDWCGEQPRVWFCAEAGEEYFLLVHGDGPSDSGTFRLEVTSTGVPAVPPANDECSGAEALVLPTSRSQFVSCATPEVLDPACIEFGAPDSPGVWYTMVGDGGMISLRQCTEERSNIGLPVVYRGTCKSGLECVPFNLDRCDSKDPSGTSRELRFCSEAGVPYTIVLFDVTRNGEISFEIDSDGTACDGPVSIETEKTVSGTLEVGEEITYFVTIDNTGTREQWNNPGPEFEDTLPDGLMLLGAGSSGGTTTVDLFDGIVEWDGRIPAGGRVVVTIRARIEAEAEGRTLCNQGTVLYDADGDALNESMVLTDDPSVGGEEDPTCFTLGPSTSPEIRAAKSVRGDFEEGGRVRFDIVLTNVGTGDQPDNPGDEFEDVLPTGFALAGASADFGTISFDTATNTVTWNGAVLTGRPVAISITADIEAGTDGSRLCNQGRAFYDADGDGTNESEVLTDDPSVGGAANPTCFVVGLVTIPTLDDLGLLVLMLVLGTSMIVWRATR